MKQRKWMMSLLVGLLAGLLAVAAKADQAATDLADPRPTPATAVEVHGDQLVVIAARQETTFNGTYENGNGSSIEFEDGEPVSIDIGIGEKPHKGSIDEVRVEDGKVVFGGDGNDILLPNGKYERQGDPEPQPKPEPEPQPRPNPNAFEVRDGKIMTVWF